MPRAAVQREALERPEPERPDGLEVAGTEKSTPAGATATTESTLSGMSVWVCVSWRYMTAHTAPRSVCSTSSAAWLITFTCTSPQRNS